jgi:peptidyl-prolyl cis-trans isomerase C
VRRVLPLLVFLLVAACSKTSGETTAAAQEPATATAPAQPEAVKPVPAQLPDVLARVNGESVTRQELQEFVDNLESRAGTAVPAEQRDQVYRRVLDQLVGYKLLQQEAKARKVVVPDAEVEARIAEIKKQFPSEDVFMQMLVERKMTVEKMRDEARDDMVISKLIETEIAAKTAVKPEQVQEFYDKNPDQFKQQERVRASHILISVPQGADAAAKTQAKTKAEQVLKDVKAGKDFAALAKEHSQDPGSAVQGGDLGFFQQGQMVGPFNDVAFALAPGAVSDLVETQFGFHIIKVAEKQAGRTIPLAEVRPQVEQFLENRNREEQTEAFVTSLRTKGKVEILI